MDAATLRRTETIALVTGSLLLAASLLLISFAGMAAGQMNPVTRQAEVIGIDHMGSSITVRLLEAALGEQSDVVTLSFNEATGVIFCSEPKSLSDIAVGDMVTVTYRQTMEGYLVENIDIPASAESPGALMC